MKRRELIRQLESAGCVLKRPGGRHDIYFNPATNRSAPVPRHGEVPDSLCNLIRDSLGCRARIEISLDDRMVVTECAALPLVPSPLLWP